MSAYFDYYNPPPSRDVQADLDRLRDHFDRLIAEHDRAEARRAALEAEAVERFSEGRA